MFSDSMMLGGGRKAAFSIAHSVRLDGVADYFTRTPSTVGNSKTWTFSVWVKRSSLVDGSYTLLNAGTSSAAFTGFSWDNGTYANHLTFYCNGTGANLRCSMLSRDVAAWYHLCLAVDTDLPDAQTSDRVRLYVNGQRVTAFDLANYPARSTATHVNAAELHQIGKRIGTSEYLDGYVASPILVDGAALDPSAFGETDPVTGSWRPKRIGNLDFGANGFHLDFAIPGNLGHDISRGKLVAVAAPIGNMTANGGLAAAFDGVTNHAASACATFAPGSGSTSPGWIGAHVGAGADITAVRVHASSNDGFVALVGRVAVLELWGNNVDDTGTASKIADLGSALDAVGLVITKNGLSVDRDVYPYLWVKIYTSETVAASKYAAEVQFVTGGVAPNAFNAVSLGAADVVADSPTNNFATLNPLMNRGGTKTLSNGNLTVTDAMNADSFVASTLAFDGQSSDGFYFECQVDTVGTASHFGVMKAIDVALSSDARSDARFWGLNFNSGNKFNGGGGAGITYGSGLTAGQTAMCAIKAGKIWWGNATTNVWFGSGDPAGGTNAAYTNLPAEKMTPCWINASGGSPQATFNFGQKTFVRTPPTGFKTLCTANLPAPSIKDPGKQMDVALYTGNGAARTITGLDFQPDFVWVKSRSAATNHALYDSVRGVQKRLECNAADVEATSDGGLTAFNSNGFDLGMLAQVNTNAATYAAWCWKAGGAAVANDAGSIPSMVSANPTAGFSIVTYTHSGGTITVGHGLGASPKMVIDKSLSSGSWIIQHASLTNMSTGYLDFTTAAQMSDASFFSSTAPSSTILTRGGGLAGSSRVAYCWAEVPGFSKFGSYTGNGSTDGPFVHCGFRPRWIMVKSTGNGSSHDWCLFDTQRSNGNVITETLFANLSNLESTAVDRMDIYANGFKIRQGAGNQPNINGETYIFAAFAEAPFGGAKTVPAKAR